jgi:1-deoxy-D-xylulose 5-phosphate reductoisomerase
VSAFLEGSIRFHDIPVVIEEVVSETPAGKLESIKEVLAVDRSSRALASERVARLSGKSAVYVGAQRH